MFSFDNNQLLQHGVKAINEEDRGSRDKIDIRLIYEIAMSI
jgi:hypothetical protein